MSVYSDAISDAYDVVGSRASGTGRGIDNPSLPVGKDPGTRSDIDFRYDTLHPQADSLATDLNNVANGAGNASPRYSSNPLDVINAGRESYPPVIRIGPR